MQVGNLRHRVTFQTKSTVQDSTGQGVHTWADSSPILTRSASIKPLKGQELIEARRVESLVLISVMVRYDPAVAEITAEDRIVRTDHSPMKIYAIHAVINHEERDRWLEFWCSEGLQDTR